MVLHSKELFRYSAPANLLLFGEYAVLERNGLGIACAVAPRVTATISPAKEFQVVGLAGGKRTVIDSTILIEHSADLPSGISSEMKFLCELTRFLITDLYPRRSKLHHILKLLSYCITIDARNCYDNAGKKVGLGSSAASAVCLTASLFHLHEAYLRSQGNKLPRNTLKPPTTPKKDSTIFAKPLSAPSTENQFRFQERIFRLALRAHRHIRGGSGYDIAASSFGRFTLFRGGRYPRVKHCNPFWAESSIRLLQSTQTVDSKKAVAHYQQWKRAHHREAKAYLRKSNQITSLALRATLEQDMIQAINMSRELQLYLGESIGVPASFPLPTHTDNYPRIAYRTVGAGNELAAIFNVAGADSNTKISIRNTITY